MHINPGLANQYSKPLRFLPIQLINIIRMHQIESISKFKKINLNVKDDVILYYTLMLARVCV